MKYQIMKYKWNMYMKYMKYIWFFLKNNNISQRFENNLISQMHFFNVNVTQYFILFLSTLLSFDLKIVSSLNAFLIILCISKCVSPFSVRAHGPGQLSALHPVFVHESVPRKVSSSWSETCKVHTFTSGARPRRTFQLR